MPAADVEYIEKKLGVHPDFPIKGINFVRLQPSALLTRSALRPPPRRGGYAREQRD
jgi:hypothetical protein